MGPEAMTDVYLKKKPNFSLWKELDLLKNDIYWNKYNPPIYQLSKQNETKLANKQ